MAVTINKPAKKMKGPIPAQTYLHEKVKADQVEVFGRLRMTHKQIAQYYNLSEGQIAYALRRPDLRAAFEKGRAETVVAIRQKQLQMALAGNVTMLLHAGFQFGEQEKELAPEPENFEPSRFSWDVEMRKRVEAAKAALSGGESDG